MSHKLTLAELGAVALGGLVVSLPLMLILPAVIAWLLPGSGDHAATMWGCVVAGIVGGGFAMYAVMRRSPFDSLNQSGPRRSVPRPSPSPDE
jgi:hypothetical protein